MVTVIDLQRPLFEACRAHTAPVFRGARQPDAAMCSFVIFTSAGKRGTAGSAGKAAENTDANACEMYI